MFAGLVFIFVGLVLAMGGTWLLLRTRRLLRAGEQTVSRVVELQLDDAGEAYFPIYEFITANGEIRRAKGIVASNPPQRKVGDAVVIVYDPKRPEDVRELRFSELWMWPLIALCCGVLIVLGGVILLLDQ